MSEYLSIKDFAESVGVSKQSIYQRIRKSDDEIKPYLKKQNGKMMVRKSAMELYNGKKDKEENINSTERLLNIFEKQLAEKDKQLAEKDDQINKLLKSLDDIQKLLDQQQQLNGMQNQILIESKEIKDNEKKGFFKRIFS